MNIPRSKTCRHTREPGHPVGWRSFSRPLMVIALAFALTAGLALPSGAQKGPRVEGRVVDSASRPLTGVGVLLEPVPSPEEATRLALAGRHPDPVEETTSDDAGRFELRAPEVGFFRLRLEKAGHATRVYELRPLLFDNSLPVATLPDATPQQVTLRGSNGKPLAGGGVAWRSAEKETTGVYQWMIQGWRPDWQRVTTEENGRARIEIDDGVGKWWVEVVAPGHAPERRQWSSGQPLRFDLVAGNERPLQVVDHEGNPVAGAIVALGEHQLPALATDERGFARLRTADQGPVQIDLLAPSGDSGQHTLPAMEKPKDGEEPEPQVLQLSPRPHVAGQVRDAETGAPLAGALVWEYEDGGQVFSRSDGAGYYSLPTTSRRGNLTVMLSGYREGRGEYALEADSKGVTASLESPAQGPNLELEAAGFVAGRVVDPEGEPVQRAEISLDLMFRGRRTGGQLITRTDERGAFEWPLVPAGMEIALKAEAEGFAVAEIELTPFEPRERREGIELVLERGSLGVGWVFDQRDNPIVGAEIRLLEPDQDPRMRFFSSDQQNDPAHRSDAEGRFEIPALVAGRYDLEAKATGHAPLLVRGIEIPEGGGEIDLGTLILAPGAALHGRVRDPEGQAIEGAEVVVSKAGEAQMRQIQLRMGGGTADAHSGRDGRFVVEDRAEGEKLEVAVTKDGYVAADLGTVTVPNERPLEVTLRPASRILGRVVDGDRRPVAEAHLLAQKDGHGGRGFRFGFGANQTTSRDDGTFEILGVEPGLVTVMVQAVGFSPLRLSGLEVPEQTPLRDLELVLETGSSLIGTVTDSDGEPASQAVVMLSNRGSGRSRSGFAHTDADGKYRIDGLPTGAQMVTAAFENGGRTTKAIDIEPGENRLDLRLASGVDVSGRVLGPSGEPVAGASVHYQAGRQIFFYGRDEVISGEGGAFTLEDLAPGRYTLKAQREGFASGESEEIEVGELPIDGLVITLGAGATIRGQVLGLAPEELPLVTIRRQGEWRSQTHPDYDGRYRLEHVPPGEHLVVAEVEQGGRRTQRSVTLEEGVPEIEVDLEFGEGHVVTGTLYHGDERVAGAAVNLYGIDVSHNSPRVTSSHDGTFRFADVPAGRHRLSVWENNSGLQHEEDVEIRGDEDLRIDIVTGQLAGRVVHEDGSPASGAVIAIESGTEERRMGQSGEADARGLFRFSRVGVGTWRVKAKKSGYSPAEEVVELRGNEVIDSLELRLEPAAGLVLDLSTTNGTRPNYLRASFVGTDGQPVAEGGFQADDDGRVLVDVVPDGSWRMILAVPGFAMVDLPVTVPGPPRAVALEPEARLEISVADLRDEPSPARLTLVGPMGPKPWLTTTGRVETETNLQGAGLVVRYLAAGAWVATITAEDGRTWSGQAVVSAGGTAMLDL